MTQGEMEEKFRTLAQSLGRGQVDQIIAMVAQLDGLPRLTELSRLLAAA